MKKFILIPILIFALFISGCAGNAAVAPESNAETTDNAPIEDKLSELNGYMASLEESADAIQTSLEKDALSQTDMNEKSAQLYKLWDDALNHFWRELKAALPEDEFSALLDEQLAWISDKDTAVSEAAADYEGGSMYALIANGEAAKITQERVYEFYNILKDLY